MFIPLDYFLHSENQNFLKNEKNARRYYHFTHVYHKWKSYLWSWDMEHNRQNFFSIWTILPPLPLTTQKKNLKKWKKRLWYHHFIQQYHKWESYDVWFLRYELQLQLHHFEPFVALLIHKQPKKLKFWKNEKNCLEISSFYSSVPKIKTRPCMVPEIWWATDRQTDR